MMLHGGPTTRKQAHTPLRRTAADRRCPTARIGHVLGEASSLVLRALRTSIMLRGYSMTMVVAIGG